MYPLQAKIVRAAHMAMSPRIFLAFLLTVAASFEARAGVHSLADLGGGRTFLDDSELIWW